MPNVEFKVGNQKFDLMCDDGQQTQIRTLAHSLDTRVNELSKNLGSAPDNLILVVTALMMEDELQNLKNQKFQNQKLNAHLEANMLTPEQVIQIIDDVVNPVVDHIEALAQKIERM